ncbi:SdrD B-like domain-containing protein [Paracoccus sp. (in: a-proteobacteria)]|uniref:SdrD B-like domain-containing protein n=1 Tax=Paracoccus sp. TaxID=267 RepID=UPI003A88C886
MTFFYKRFEWTAFTEADLLANGRNGHDFNSGDKFVVGSSTVKMSTYDNEKYLSGDDWINDCASDLSGQKAYIDNCRIGSQMYAEQYHVLKDASGHKYVMIEIRIEGHDSPGAGNGYFTFYGDCPPAGTELTVVETCNVKGSWIDYTCFGAGKPGGGNNPPVFTNIPSDGVFCVDENTKLVIDLDAKDPDNDNLSFSITGGPDGALFDIDASTGVLSFKQAPDYEKPADYNLDNIYKVNVAVSDGKGGVTQKELKVEVCDVDESTQKCVVIEAEHMQLRNYCVEGRHNASGGKDIMLVKDGGYAHTTWNGASGTYDMKMTYMDENDGQGSISVYVNGSLIKKVVLDQNTDGNGNSKSTWSEIELKGITVNKGDVIKLVGDADRYEAARIDKIELCPIDPKPQVGALQGRLFVDEDANGVDDDEPGVGGVTVTLLSAAGTTLATTTTAANGSYAFTNLQPGDYKVVFPTSVGGRTLTQQDVGSDDSIDSDANVSTGQTGNYTVQPGQTVTDVDAGLVAPPPPAEDAAIEGRVFADDNGNNVDDSEAGIGGVTVALLDAGGNVVATTTTAANGGYSFGGLPAGDYQVRFPTDINGRGLVDANVGGDDTIDSDANVSTGLTGTITLATSQVSRDNDAGIKPPADPKDASIGDLVFLDANKNGLQDAGEAGVAGVDVTLYDAGGNAVATTSTGTDGKYLFSGLAAGSYSVGFAEAAGYSFTTANAGGNDALDSDADQTTGRTGTITLAVSEANMTVDAGLVADNRGPDAMDDSGKTCADTPKTINVLANDTDPDGDSLTITAVAGQAISEGQSVTAADGVKITLTGGQLVFDATGTSYDDALIGTHNSATYSYSISDGNGGTDTANVAMTFCGTVNTLQTIEASLPSGGTMVVTLDNAFGGDFYNVTLSGSGDDRLDGKSFDAAYCLAASEGFTIGQAVPYDLYLAAEGSVPAGVVARPQNLDVINWIMNQNFEAQDNGDGTGVNYTEAEIQGAIWGLTDDLIFVGGGLGTYENAEEIRDLALANGEGFTPGEDDIVGLVLNPTAEAQANGNTQPFIIGIPFSELEQDCICV